MSAAVGAMIALALFGLFGLIGLGWRTWLQHRRTGSSGLSAVGGTVGSAEWVAGLGFVVTLVVTVLGVVLQLRGVVSPVRVLDAPGIHISGIAVAILGIAVMVRAQIDMGDSWRIGVDQRETTALVRTGMFGRIRNPIYAAMLAFALGIALLAPNPVSLLGSALALATVELQVRRVEEPYLLAKHGDAYRGYTARVGRFIPGVGLIR